MHFLSSFGIFLFGGFVICALGAETTTISVSSAQNTTAASTNSSVAEANEVPKSDVHTPDQKAMDPTRPPGNDISTVTPALVRDVTSSTPKPNAAISNNLPNNKTVVPTSVPTKKDGKQSGASALTSGIVTVGAVALLISGSFS